MTQSLHPSLMGKTWRQVGALPASRAREEYSSWASQPQTPTRTHLRQSPTAATPFTGSEARRTRARRHCRTRPAVQSARGRGEPPTPRPRSRPRLLVATAPSGVVSCDLFPADTPTVVSFVGWRPCPTVFCPAGAEKKWSGSEPVHRRDPL